MCTRIVNHYHEIHILLGIEQAGIRVILGTSEFEHAITFGAERP
jgi:hypothetical protein